MYVVKLKTTWWNSFLASSDFARFTIRHQVHTFLTGACATSRGRKTECWASSIILHTGSAFYKVEYSTFLRCELLIFSQHSHFCKKETDGKKYGMFIYHCHNMICFYACNHHKVFLRQNNSRLFSLKEIEWVNKTSRISVNYVVILSC